jgi:predicted N-acetyltransferase YhbS
MTSSISIRSGTPTDAAPCGEICFKAFHSIASAHNFPPDFPSPNVAIGLIGHLLSRPDAYSVVAEIEGKIVGSNFLWEGDIIAGIGPVTVDPTIQNRGVGREMMQGVLRRASEKKFVGVRLVQSAYHNRSLSLYTKLGFEVREPLALFQGAALKKSILGLTVRPAVESDEKACSRLCEKIHGHNRQHEFLGAVQQQTATVVERHGRITGYSTGVGFFGHSVGETNDDLKALIGAAGEFSGPGMLLPTRNTEVFRWCLEQGLRVTQPLTLMSIGLYNEPRGAFIPSILF